MFSAIWLLGTVRFITDQGFTYLSRGEIRRGASEARILGLQGAAVGFQPASAFLASGGKFGREFDRDLGRDGSLGRFASLLGGALGDDVGMLFGVLDFLGGDFFEERGFEDGRGGRLRLLLGATRVVRRGFAARRFVCRRALRLDGIFAGDDDARRRVDPFAGVIDARDGADGANDAAGRDGGFVDAFDHAFEGEAEIEAASSEEAGGVGVAVDG